MNFTPSTDAHQQAALADLVGDLNADQLRDLVVHLWLRNLSRVDIKSWRRATGLSPALPRTHMDV